MGTRRCSICNITNNRYIAEIAGWSSEKTKTENYFKKDPDDESAYICLKCNEEIQEALMELNLEDDKDKKIE